MHTSINRDREDSSATAIKIDATEVNVELGSSEEPTEFIKKQPLTPDEIEEAKQRIRKMHPLKILTLDKVFPAFACCLKRCKSRNEANARKQNTIKQDEQESLNKLRTVVTDLGLDKDGRMSESLIKTEDNTDSENENKEEEDPYLKLGFGLCAYFNLMRVFIFTFFVLTILSLPIMFTYKSHEGLLDTSNYERSQFSLGNMGFSGTTCQHYYLGITSEITFSCKVGKIRQLYGYGIIPNNLTNSSQDLVYCGNFEQAPSDIRGCYNYILANFDYHFNTSCFGKSFCDLNFTFNEVIHAIYSSNECLMPDSRFYIQYSCEQDIEDITLKRYQGLMAACIGIFMCLVFLLSIYYLSSTSYIDYKLWDVFTVTAADFTVEFQISELIWTKFCMMPESSYGESKAVAFEAFLKQEFQKIISDEPGVLTEQLQEIKIANVSFAFDNAKIIKLLWKRGTIITNAQYEKLCEVDKEINKLKEDQFEKLTRPVTAFITFETQEGYERACNITAKRNICCKLISRKQYLLGEPLYFEEATEPTNIIWENRHIGFWRQLANMFIAGIFIGIVLIIALLIFFILKRQTISNQSVYPPSRDCDLISNLFLNNGTGYKYFAEIDRPSTGNSLGTGVYQCYCSDSDYTSDESCVYYKKDSLTGTSLSSAVSCTVVIINLILRAINMKIITLIGYHTESEQTKAIMTSVFLSTFLNTGILCILTNANTSQTILKFLWFLDSGSYSDLTFEWYIDIGTALAQTMFINAVMPLIEFSYGYPLRYLFRAMDRGCSKNSSRTKKFTIQQYVNLHAGPIHMMHFKYSSIINITFVTFMYGLSLPILFPIALISFLVVYGVEKLTLTYYYRKPPMYDEKMNAAALSLLKWAPFTMVCFGYWAMGNNQIFSNAVIPKERATDVTVTLHDAFDFNEINQTTPLFIFTIVFFVAIFFNDLILTIFTKLRLCTQKKDDEVDEQLGNYFECISPLQRQTWFLDEKHLQTNLGIYTLDQYSLEKLQNSKVGHKLIQDCSNYEILSNIKYSDAFQFTPLEMRDTQQEKDASDQVMRILLMAYTSKQKVQGFKMRNTFVAPKKEKEKEVVKSKIVMEATIN